MRHHQKSGESRTIFSSCGNNSPNKETYLSKISQSISYPNRVIHPLGGKRTLNPLLTNPDSVYSAQKGILKPIKTLSQPDFSFYSGHHPREGTKSFIKGLDRSEFKICADVLLQEGYKYTFNRLGQSQRFMQSWFHQYSRRILYIHTRTKPTLISIYILSPNHSSVQKPS